LPIKISKRIDILSAWFYEENSDPDNLYISLKIMDLDAKVKTKNIKALDIIGMIVQKYFKNTFLSNIFKQIIPVNSDEYQAVYAVTWLMYNNNFYSTLLHKNPDGSIYSSIGASRDDNDIIDDWYEIESTFDENNNIITWIIPKDKIDNPTTGVKIRDISAHTHLRRISDTEGPDLSKDLTLDPIVKNDYIIKY